MPRGRQFGHIVTEETRKKISLAFKGKPSGMLGKYHSEEAKKKMSIAHKGKQLSKSHRKKIGISHIGKKYHTEESKKRISIANSKGGITSIARSIRASLAYEEWRIKVFERDLYTCQDCKKVGGYLNADHIKSFSDFPELRLEVSNGRTLCRECHYFKTWNKILPKDSKWGKILDSTL